MVTAYDFEMALEVWSPWSLSKIQKCTRALRDVGYLPRGARGSAAPEINAEHAATILIAVAAGAPDDPRKAEQLVVDYCTMVRGDRPTGRFPLTFKGNARLTFGKALALCLADYENSVKQKVLKFCTTWPEAELSYADSGGKLHSLTFKMADADQHDHSGVREDITFPKGIIHQLAIVLHHGRARAAWAGGRASDGK